MARATRCWIPSATSTIVDQNNNRIRKIAQNGTVSTVIGGPIGFSGDGGAASSARINSPIGLARDASGSLYFSDSRNHRVRRIDGAGTITTVAGNGSAITTNTGDGGAAIDAPLNEPSGLAIDAAGNLYIADASDNRVRKVAPDGTITTVAGTGVAGYTGDGAAATAAQFSRPTGIDVDAGGNLYIADLLNNAIRKVATDGTVTSLDMQDFLLPFNVAISPSGAPYYTSGGFCQVYKIEGGIQSIVVAYGNDTCDVSGDGGLARTASMGVGDGIAFDGVGGYYVVDNDHGQVRYVGSDGLISTFAGRSHAFTDGDDARTVPLSWGLGIAVGRDGQVAIADTFYSSRVVEVTAAGAMRLRAGDGRHFNSVCQSLPCLGKDFPLRVPTALAYAPDGSLYISDRSRNRVYRVDAAGMLTSVAGKGGTPTGDGTPATTQAVDPYGIGFDAAGNWYVADKDNYKIHKVDTAGMMVTIGYAHPTALTVDAAGTVYYYDVDLHAIRKQAPSGVVTTIAGGGTEELDGVPALQTYIPDVVGLAVRNGEIYFTANGRIRHIDGSGIVTTLPFDWYAQGLAVNAGALFVNTQNGSVWRAALPLQSVAHDFDGDGRADLFWRHAGNGSNALWKGGVSTTQQSVASVTNTAWKIAGVGDFDADGRADLVWRNTTTGANTIWRSADNTTQIAVTGVSNMAWKLVGVGDFDGDGRSDLFWRNDSTGANTIWRSGQQRHADRRWRA
jgi:hypothetical protein